MDTDKHRSPVGVHALACQASGVPDGQTQNTLKRELQQTHPGTLSLCNLVSPSPCHLVSPSSRLLHLAIALLASLLTTHAATILIDQQKNVVNRIKLGSGMAGLVGSSPGQFKAVMSLGSAAPFSKSTGSLVIDNNDRREVPQGDAGGSLRIKFGFVRIGAPAFGQETSFLFGQVIPPPNLAEDNDTEVVGASYWAARPYVASDALSYRWDGRRVLAKQNGTDVKIVWRKRKAFDGTPEEVDLPKYHIEGGNYFRIHTSQHTFKAGDVIAPPTKQEDGATDAADDYWAARPHSLRETERYYYSPSSQLVYATQPGPVDIIWRKLEAYDGTPSDPENYQNIGGNYYLLHSVRTVVSGAPVQPPRKIYWTGTGEAGIPVIVPKARINGVKIVYNSEFPEHVPVSQGTPFNGDSGATSEGGGVETAQTATFWYSSTQGALNALNRQGRVFMELLGRPDITTGIPEQLGIEIVDVVRQPISEDATVELGEIIPKPDGNAELSAQIANSPQGDDFVFRHFPGGADSEVFYAKKETRNVNDIILWWLEPGQQGIRWPRRYIRYDMNWPSDPAKYSHYVRPAAADDAEAQKTAVAMPTDNVPTIDFQDLDPTGNERADLTADFKFYTWLNDAFPAHRTLMRFTSGDYVRFERIFSWLDDTVKLNAPASALVEVAEIQNDITPGIVNVGGPMDLAVVGNKLYVAATEPNGFSLIDVSNPAAPVTRYQDTGYIQSLRSTWAVTANSDRAFVASYYDDRIRVYDEDGAATTVERNIQDGSAPLDKLNGPRGLDVSADGRYLYIATPADDSLTVFDLENQPNAWKIFGTSLDGATNVAVHGNHAYVANASGQSLAIVDVSDPASLNIVATVSGMDSPRHVEVAPVGNQVIAFVSEQNKTVRIVDVTTPGSPVKLASIVETDDLGTTPQPRGTAYAGGLLYITYRSGNAVSVWDVSTPSAPKRLALYRKSDSRFAKLDGPVAIDVANDRAFVACFNSDTIISFGVQHLNYARTRDISLIRGSVAASLSSFDQTDGFVRWSDPAQAPRVVEAEALVGSRINPPAGEIGGDGSTYLAGRIHYVANDPNGSISRPRRDAFHTVAYIDPFVSGFEEANQGAIIPVNAIPGDDVLEVWWFRTNNVDTTVGFDPIYWPSVIGRYTVRYPTEADTDVYNRIVLASNDGTGPLASLQAKGSIYIQNKPELPGYNPNEEHALMIGGQGWALRDDLNLVDRSTLPAVLDAANSANAAVTYSSDPYVLLSYTEFDGRPAVSSYHVLRTTDQHSFNYTVEAGKILQPPMPLPLLDKPLVTSPVGGVPFSLNASAKPIAIASHTAWGSDPYEAILTLKQRPYFGDGVTLAVQESAGSSGNELRWFHVYRDGVDTEEKTMKGFPASAIRSVRSGSSVDGEPEQYRYELDLAIGAADDDIVLLVNDSFSGAWIAQVKETGVDDATVTVDFPTSGGVSAQQQSANRLMVLAAVAEDDLAEWIIANAPVPAAQNGNGSQLSSFIFQDRKGSLWVYRGPNFENDPSSLAMRYYYKKLAGFNYPSLSLDKQPADGTITPYLRALSDGEDGFLGDPVYGDVITGQSLDVPETHAPDQVGDANALEITYTPVWPAATPTLLMAESLMHPKRGLPAMRGQRSLQILYQQSKDGVQSNPKDSVVLHDPTREKQYELGSGNLAKLPDSIQTSLYQGKTYFPQLPPHLVDRFFFDPNRGTDGALVFRGDFVDSPLGEDYLLLNVIGAKDALDLKALCAVADTEKSNWDEVIDSGLQTRMELFVESNAKPGTFVASEVDGDLRNIGPADLAEVRNDDEPVDSYALTAKGPGVGYVTLVSGNGLAFQPADEPVSLHIIKVVKELHRGEVKIVQSSNPLSEKLTFQQVVDLAGETDDFNFEWKIAAPVDGAPPPVFQNTPVNLLSAGSTWSHVRDPYNVAMTDDLAGLGPGRVVDDVRENVVAVSEIAIPGGTTTEAVAVVGENLRISFGSPHYLAVNTLVDLVAADTEVQARIASVDGNSVVVTTVDGSTSLTRTETVNDASVTEPVANFTSVREVLATEADQPESIVFTTVTMASADSFTEYWLSLELDDFLGAKVYVNGATAVSVNLATDNTATTSAPGDISALSKAFRLTPGHFSGGTKKADGTFTHTIAVELFSEARAGTPQTFDLQLDGVQFVDLVNAEGSQWLDMDPLKFADGIRAVLGGSADIRALSDNYVIMRYRADDQGHASFVDGGGWSLWTEPVLAEGWIKRVLAGINPFNQRVTDLFANRVDTDASVLTEAGPRWEGNVALNLDSINDFGLIEIYETVLNRGRDLSIDAGINYGPANDALLLAAGYINDLYMMIGNEAFADAANPTIGIGTADNTYGDIATSLFAFKGQLPNLLEEELALLRGRDDFMQPGVEIAPAYNRMFWNFTRGIDSGEVIYALNYNIREDNDGGVNGTINADDARKMYPQGHGDAYGHYLTALKGYYKLLLDEDFTWVPRTEAVNVLGKPVQVDYLDERKFATAAAATARTGKQVFDLTWRKDYQSGDGTGWEHFATNRVNSARQQTTTRHWGMDHWATRVHQGAYFNWVTGNAMLPELDGDPSHEGIQKIDRTTVPELKELAVIADDLQTSLDNAEAGLNPLGMPDGAIALDINPNQVVAAGGQTHFEQIYGRATKALNNATVAFDDAKDVTRLLRSEEDSLSDFQTKVAQQELAYKHQLIELYGTPYTDDIGPGKTYEQGYDGPDLFHYSYVDEVEQTIPNWITPQEDKTFHLDAQVAPFTKTYNELLSELKSEATGSDQLGSLVDAFSFDDGAHALTNMIVKLGADEHVGNKVVEYTVKSHGFGKPGNWTGRRASPGEIQSAMSGVILSVNSLREALESHTALKYQLDREVELYVGAREIKADIKRLKNLQLLENSAFDVVTRIYNANKKLTETAKKVSLDINALTTETIPQAQIFGMANGGDILAGLRFAGVQTHVTTKRVLDGADASLFFIQQVAQGVHAEFNRWYEPKFIAPLESKLSKRESIHTLDMTFGDVQMSIFVVNDRIQKLDESQRKLRALTAKGDRIQAEREIFRQRSAAVIQGYRTRDSAFRLFRNEKLERYKTLFDLASKYAFLAAQAYDYETGLLGTDVGRGFVNRIISSRALGVVQDGEPHFAGSNTGDPGLSSALAEMKADWDVLKGRLGFNNHDAYGTTVSMRQENFRIVPGSNGDPGWQNILHAARVDDLLQDADVKRHALNIDSQGGLPVPGILLEFSTSIEEGRNLFGRPLAGGDHAFSISSFATKIFSVGVALEGYQGMDDPTAATSAVEQGGGTSPTDPTAAFLDPLTLAANPDVYLIPVGTDYMRSPPLGDQNALRSWTVQDVTIPLPFNIGASDFSSKPLWQSRDSLTEELFGLRKHQAFRPVSTTAAFPQNVVFGSGIRSSEFTNNRLIGRSIWNTRWKLIIPGRALLNDPNEGLDRFIQTVKDIKIHFATYSYSGN